jgi:hypothetical protein
MEAGEVEIQLHSFLTSAVNGRQLSKSHPSRFAPGTHLGGPQRRPGRWGEYKIILPLPGFEPPNPPFHSLLFFRDVTPCVLLDIQIPTFWGARCCHHLQGGRLKLKMKATRLSYAVTCLTIHHGVTSQNKALFSLSYFSNISDIRVGGKSPSLYNAHIEGLK